MTFPLMPGQRLNSSLYPWNRSSWRAGQRAAARRYAPTSGNTTRLAKPSKTALSAVRRGVIMLPRTLLDACVLRADEPVVFLLVPVYHCFKAIPGDDGAAARLCQFSPPPRIANQGRHGRRERGGS